MAANLRPVPSPAAEDASRRAVVIAKWESAQHAGVLFANEARIPMREVEGLLIVEPDLLDDAPGSLGMVERELDILIARLQRTCMGWSKMENLHDCEARSRLAADYWRLFLDCRARLLSMARPREASGRGGGPSPISIRKQA